MGSSAYAKPGERLTHDFMAGGVKELLSASEQDRRDVFEATARRLDTLPGYVEKDLWACIVLDVLYNRLPAGHPNLLFKGGTSLSKAFGLIDRFSEDIDIVVSRDGLGFSEERDPAAANSLSNKKRAALFEELRTACSAYVIGELKTTLVSRLDEVAGGCRVLPDVDAADGQTLLVEYPTLFPSREVAYVAPRVRIEAGARSAVIPNLTRTIIPFIADELPDWSWDIAGIRVIAPERTYWEKLLILHGLHCGYRDEGRLPHDRDRISRHYYDAAMITPTDRGESALSNLELLEAVRNHNLLAFRQAWKRFDEAIPGSVKLVPQSELRSAIEADYDAMQDMILGRVPDFGWIMDQLQYAEATINGT